MKLPHEFEDQYVKEVLYNTSLQNLPAEDWKLIEGFEGYAVSNYGRIKSLERWVTNPLGRKRKIPEQIMKLQFMKFFNKYLNRHFYNITCLLSSEGQRSRKSVPRLVYSNFVEKLDAGDKSCRISFKDNNRFHIHAQNLEKLSISEERYKRVQTDRVQNHKDIYEKAISQYNVDGGYMGSFKNIEDAGRSLNISSRHLFAVINKERFTAGGFRWFLQEYTPAKQDFIPSTKKKTRQLLNVSLWKKFGKPSIDCGNPPACMNLSLENLPGEEWKRIPELSDLFAISNKGRIKRLSYWTSSKNKRYVNEHIMSLFLITYSGTNCYLYANVRHKGKQTHISLNKLLYYCFIKEFDLTDRSLVVTNKSENAWDINLSKLELRSAAYHLNNK